MHPRLLAAALVVALGTTAPLLQAQRSPDGGAPAAPTTRDSALHVLERLAYGPRPGEVARVAHLGIARWVDQQLHPEALSDGGLGAAGVLDYDRASWAGIYVAALRERHQRLRAATTPADTAMAGPAERRARELAGRYLTLTLARAAQSERQLDEILVDFWANHFNVLYTKGADRFLLPDYIEHGIRPHVLGRFADLLVATAESPAMLFYLDNWESVAPGAEPPAWRGLAALLGTGAARQRPQGLNENYARELLELHTLGVDGGYTQQDVIEVARIFTGWSIARPFRGGGFEFHAWAHDYGPKVVLGVAYPGGHGMDEGVRLLDWLARQPATMHHVSRQLCQRFVSDDPPDGCVDDAVAAWRRSDGDLREVVRAIVTGPDFWAAAAWNGKTKTPLGFLVSALRALDAQLDTSPRLPRVLARLGEPLYLHTAPDGYPDTTQAWVNSGALLDRMNVAVALAADRLPGAAVDLDALIAPTEDLDALVEAVDDRILAGTMTATTRRVIREEAANTTGPIQARALAIGLALGGPEFQRR